MAVLWKLASVALLLTSLAAFAEDGNYHYKSILVGERASGLGGAYTAISDDPSGVYHNPAGIVFSLENYLSLSANGLATGSTTYENVYPGQNYVYRSSD